MKIQVETKREDGILVSEGLDFFSFEGRNLKLIERLREQKKKTETCQRERERVENWVES